MKIHKILSSAAKGLIMGISFICVIAIAFAFTTWSSGNAPQASPANGNVKILPIPLVCSGSDKALQWNGSAWSCANIYGLVCLDCYGNTYCANGFPRGGSWGVSTCCGLSPECRGGADQN